MTSQSPDNPFTFAISLSVLNHLGRNLYRNFITVLGEAVSNAWDADANNVWIEMDKSNKKFLIWDDGDGMTPKDFQSKFLMIGYSKRKQKNGTSYTKQERPFIGAKGIGKLALLSCAKRVSVFSKTEKSGYVGGVIDNSGLDEAISDNLKPENYQLEELNFDLINHIEKNHKKGTILVFEGAEEILRNSAEYIRKLLALYFRFSLLDSRFTIHFDGTPISINDLQELSTASQFLWIINDYSDEYVNGLLNLKGEPAKLTSNLKLKGFVASVNKPRDLKISGTDERATIDLFVNGRLREKNIIRHIPTQRIVESYIYGQIHFDVMDQKDTDPFTSSREGVIEGDTNFQDLMNYLKKDFMQKLFDKWDQLRTKRGLDGDDENPRMSKKSRKARSLYTTTSEELSPEPGSPEKEQVDKWIEELLPEADFNFSAYSDCFLSENLVRKFIRSQNIELDISVANKIKDLKVSEKSRKGKANISFQIREGNDDLSYLGMDDLAFSAEGSKSTNKGQSLWSDARSYAPVRNVVGHTGLLTRVAKKHLSVTYENMKGRVKALLRHVK